MNSTYQRIDGAEYHKIYVVGDLHGCYDLLMRELEKVQFNFNKDLLVSVGDLIDRGIQNIECLELIGQPWFKAVRGNHEQMAINAVIDNNKQSLYAWLMNGGNWYFDLDLVQKRTTDLLIAKCQENPLVIELNVDGRKIVIAHADYPGKYEYGKEVSNKQVLWSRERFESGNMDEIQGADAFVFGHTPVEEWCQFDNVAYIDTGAVFGNKLTLLQFK